MPAFASLQIEVLDKNNQAPYFLESSYHGYVAEGSPVGTSVAADASLSDPLAVVALDNDVEEVSLRSTAARREPLSGFSHQCSQAYQMESGEALDKKPLFVFAASRRNATRSSSITKSHHKRQSKAQTRCDLKARLMRCAKVPFCLGFFLAVGHESLRWSLDYSRLVTT